MTVQNEKTNGGLGTFAVNFTESTAVNFLSNGKSAVLVMETGIYISLR